MKRAGKSNRASYKPRGEIIQLLEKGRPVPEVAHQLGCDERVLHKWIARIIRATPAAGDPSEIYRLRGECARLEIECTTLKNAAARFMEETKAVFTFSGRDSATAAMNTTSKSDDIRVWLSGLT